MQKLILTKYILQKSFSKQHIYVYCIYISYLPKTKCVAVNQDIWFAHKELNTSLFGSFPHQILTNWLWHQQWPPSMLVSYHTIN